MTSISNQITNPTMRLLLENLPLETEDDSGGVTPATLAKALGINRGTAGSCLVLLMDKGHTKRIKNPNATKGYVWWKKKEVRKPKIPRLKTARPEGIHRNVVEINKIEVPDTPIDDLEQVLERFLKEYKNNKDTLQLIAECLRDAGF